MFSEGIVTVPSNVICFQYSLLFLLNGSSDCIRHKLLCKVPCLLKGAVLHSLPLQQNCHCKTNCRIPSSNKMSSSSLQVLEKSITLV